MVALVTGASGFLGRHLTRHLARAEGRVRVLLRHPEQAELFDGLPVEVVVGDLANRSRLARAVAGATHVYHCAAASTDWAPRATFLEANVAGVHELVAALSGSPTLERLIHVSTTDVYGYPTAVCDESGPMVDAGLPYNQTKIASEDIVRAAERKQGLPVTVFRPATIYGPGSHDFVTDIHQQLRQRTMPLVGGGRTSPGWLYVDNAVEAMVGAAYNPDALGQVYNLRDETAESWREYLDAFADAAGLKRAWIHLPVPGAVAMAATLEQVHRRLRLSARPLLTRHAVLILSRPADFPIEKARLELGFRSTVGFEEGVERSVRWASDAARDRPTRWRQRT